MGDHGQDDEVVELDPDQRFCRYSGLVGKGRFKQLHRAFDTQLGTDVAWSKIDVTPLHQEQLAAVAREVQKGLELNHPNIIRCFQCWEAPEHRCINLITELFTSGNLRQYRNLHKHLDQKAIKRMARQILKGLEYLHGMQPPITHGDLRCDKIYVNGHSGEIKIGDLGLATLQPYRWQEQQHVAAANGDAAAGEEGSSMAACGAPGPHQPEGFTSTSSFSPSCDIFAFGLCMLELLTLKQLDPQHCPNLHELVSQVQDDECRQFVSKCVAPPEERPTAVELLEHPFLTLRKPQPSGGMGGQGYGGSDADLNTSLNASGGRALLDTLNKRRTDEQHVGGGGGGGVGVDQEGGAPIAVGKLRGEDYNFEFHGKVKDHKMHFRLVMTEASSTHQQRQQQLTEGEEQHQPFMRTIDFVFDPEFDTADNLASEISDNFNLSPTDTEICAAALREWLAKEMPGTEGPQK